MRALAAAFALALAFVGCAAPDATPAPQEGPIDLTGKLGLLLVDQLTREVTTYTEETGLAWMSAGAHVITWTEGNYAIYLNRTSGVRHIAAVVVWARVYDNDTGLELARNEARIREIVTGNTLHTTPIGTAPREGGQWSGASDDLRVFGLETQGARPLACQNDIALRSDRLDRTLGCHLRVASDGRAGWTEATAVRMREVDGDIVNLTPPGSGNPANGTFVAHENPIFPSEGVLMLRITGGERVALTQIVDEEGTALAKMTGPRRLALHDVSEDGRYILVRAFER